MESHSENQQLVSAEIQESINAAPSGGQKEIQSEPGYRFWPTDEEIIVHYLRRKMADPNFKSRAIPDKDIYSFDPRDGEIMSQENLFFFTKKTIKKNHRGIKMSRVRFGKGGCWNYLGTETWIYSDSEGSNLLIGVKENYRFYVDPGKTRTNWNMIEYGLPENDPQDWVVCRVFFKKGDLKVDPPEKWPGASGSSSTEVTLPTKNFQHSERSKQTANEMASFSAGPVVSSNDSSQLDSINTAVGSSSMHMYTKPAMLQQYVASMGTVYRSQKHSDERRGYNLNQPQINMATQQQQGQPRPINRSSTTHSDEQRIHNHNKQPANMPHGPAHRATSVVSTTPYNMVNQQQPGISTDSKRTLGWTFFNPNFTQPDFGSTSSPGPRLFFNHKQQSFNMPILQGQYQPAYPANNMLSTNHYNMANQQLPGISTPPYLRPDVTTRPVGGNFNPNLTQPDVGSNSSHNSRPRSGNYNQSSEPRQGSDSQPSKYRKT